MMSLTLTVNPSLFKKLPYNTEKDLTPVTAVVKALALPDVRQRLATMGADGIGNTPQQFTAFIKAEIAKWAKVVKDAGIKIE